MKLNWLDWLIILSYFAVSLGIGLAFRKRAGKSLAEFFLSGRSLPWWIAGTSMVATTFAADTPLAVTGLVAKYGLAGNWFWWAMAVGGMFTVFIYSRLWRRAEVMTDVELIELRYGGRPAAFLRGFRSIYIALPITCIIIGWVTSAMVKILDHTVFAGIEKSAFDHFLIIAACLLVVAVYSALSGMWGVAITDFIQFLMAMGGCIALAWLAVRDAGGVASLREQVAANFPGGEQAFHFFPNFSAADAWMPLQMFLVYLFILWWASWYPGAEPGGGGYVVQRMASCKNERHSLLATLWFQVAHYCVRPWPWLLVAFAALARYPNLRELPDPGVGFPMMIHDLAPMGLRGLLLVAFFAAFMSTLSTQINWGASYLVSDFYKRFIRPDADEKHLATASRVATVVMLLCGGLTAYAMREVSVDQAWKFLAALGAGTGAVFMLRWFWWRINAWSEITAMVASLIFFSAIKIVAGILNRMGITPPEILTNGDYTLALVAGLTLPAWLIVTFLTPPEKEATLLRFFRQTHPGGPGWNPIRRLAPEALPDRDLPRGFACVALGVAVVFLTLPGLGFLIFGQSVKAVICLGLAAACFLAISALLKRAPAPPASA